MASAATAATPQLEPGVARDLARWRAQHYSDVRYDLELALAPPIEQLQGTLQIRVTLRGEPVDLVLDWRPPAQGSALSGLEANGLAIERPRIVREHLVIPVRHVRGGENVIRLRFTAPIAAAGTAVTRYGDREDGAEYIYSLFVPADASTVFPCFDQPDLKARFTLGLVLPAAWEAVSNAPAAETTEHDGAKRVRFRESEPISTYLFAFAAGPLQSLDERDAEGGAPQPATRLLVRKSQRARARAEAREVFRLHDQAVAFFSDYFGFSFPFAKHDLVLVPEFPYGGMEHAGATFLREESVLFPFEPSANDRLRRAQLIFHETSHQWFGDLVTMRWFDDLWLKEGFANFMAAKATEQLLPEYNTWNAFHQLKVAAYRTDATPGTTPIRQPLPNLAAAKSAYGSIVYSKAPAVLRQAEFYLGADAFQRAVQALIHAHAFAAADWNDVVHAFEQASGRKLDGWARAWVTRRGMPVVRAEWRADRGRITRFVVSQSAALGTEALWPMRTELLLAGPDGARTLPVMLEGRTLAVRELVGTPAPRYVYANHGDYAYGRFALDDASRTALPAAIGTIADPFLRALLLGALWEEVRDARLAPLRYIALALAQVGAETDEVTVASLLNRVQTGLRWYLSDSQRAAAAPGVEATLLEGMTNAAEKGLRITYFRAYVGAATTAAARSTLQSLLAGTLAVPGVHLSSRERFRIIERLLALGDPDAERLLEAEAQADQTDDGRRYAFAAAAAAPVRATKARYFAAYRGDAALAESWIEDSIAPFNTIEQAPLTLPYLARALADLPRLRRSRKIFFVNNWLAAFLAGQASPAALAQVRSFLRTAPLDPDLRRKVLEAMDGLARTVRIRERYGAAQAPAALGSQAG